MGKKLISWKSHKYPKCKRNERRSADLGEYAISSLNTDWGHVCACVSRATGQLGYPPQSLSTLIFLLYLCEGCIPIHTNTPAPRVWRSHDRQPAVFSFPQEGSRDRTQIRRQTPAEMSCHPSALIFEMVSLAEPGAHCFNRTG